MATTATGGCLCSGVRFTIADPPSEVTVCHCDMCRRWTSGPMMALHPKTAPRMEATETLAWHRSSEWAERGFCNRCGASLFYRIVGKPDETYVSAGAVDDPGIFSGIGLAVFSDERPAFYDFKGDHTQMTGAEVFALFGGKNSGDDA
jgi:hypothetical protein